MAICKRAVSFAGDTITAGGVMEAPNDISECAYTIRSGFNVPCTAHFFNPDGGLTRRPNREQRGVVEALGVKTCLNKGTLVGECKCVGRIPDIH